MTTTEQQTPQTAAAQFLADALSVAAREYALSNPRRTGDGRHLASAEPIDLMPHVVAQLLARPDLLRALLERAEQASREGETPAGHVDRHGAVLVEATTCAASS